MEGTPSPDKAFQQHERENQKLNSSGMQVNFVNIEEAMSKLEIDQLTANQTDGDDLQLRQEASQERPDEEHDIDLSQAKADLEINDDNDQKPCKTKSDIGKT